MTVTLALDTCILSDREFIEWAIRESDVDLVVPVVAYMERRRQILNRGRDPGMLEEFLRKGRMKVSMFDKECATRASDFMSLQPRSCPECGKLDWADVIILANIDRPQAILVTHNIGDFEGYGMDDRIMTPEEVVNRFTEWQ